jgi:uncharacterized protein YukE
MTFADTTNPVARLNAPGDYRELTTQSVTDALGTVAGWINDVIAWLTGLNFVQWLTEAVGGDWGDILSIRDVWNDLSWASGDISTNLVRGLTELNPDWDGNAAKAFEAHMTKWYQAFVENQGVCAAIRDYLTDLARVAKEFLQALIDVIQLLLSLIGPGILGAILRAMEIKDTIQKGYQAYRRIKNAIDATISFFQLIAAAGQADNLPNTRVTVPDTPYGGPTAPGTM